MNLNRYQKVYHTLRIAIAMCFIGHGAFGIITKAIWCNYFAVFGIGQQAAYNLMPILGTIDILLGLIMLLYPNRAIAAWLVIWGIITALLRPLSGEHIAEFIERAGNYAAPLAWLLLVGIPKKFKDLFSMVPGVKNPAQQTPKSLIICLQLGGFLLLVGHGWLNLAMKKGLLVQYSTLGFSDVTATARIIGMVEIAGAFILLIKPYRELVLVLFMWKMISEAFYPGYPLFEWIERGGSYGVLLALWFLTDKTLLIGNHRHIPGFTKR